MLDFLRMPLNWVAKRHLMWIAFPYFVLAAMGTFPSVWGVGCSAGASVLFLLCLAGWRVNTQ